jgi:hypothetical protein
MKIKLLLGLLFVSCFTFGQWQFEGASNFTGTAGEVALAIDVNDVPYVLYSDNGVDGKAHVKKFNGTSWVNVGVGISEANVPSLLAIAINPTNNQPWVAYKNTSSAKIDVKSFDGTIWQTESISLGNITPLYKIDLKISPAGVALLATQYSSTNLRIFNDASSGATYENLVIVPRAFDLISYNKLLRGTKYRPYSSAHWRARIFRHTKSSPTASWVSSSYQDFNNGNNGTSTFARRVAGSLDDKILVNLHDTAGSNLKDQMDVNLASTMPNLSNPKNYQIDYHFNTYSQRYYAMFVAGDDSIQVQEYDAVQDTWTVLTTSLSFAGFDSHAKMEINTTGDKVYLAYLDGSTNKVNVQYYTPQQVLDLMYVDINATGNNDGTSWADAYTDLQNAIDSALGEYSALWVAQGTYKPGTLRTATFKINKGIKIYGGFNGTETLLTQRNVANHLTILSGDLNNNDNLANIIDTEPTRQDNAYHIVSVKGNIPTDGTGLLDGFTITGANANGTVNNSCSTAQVNQFYNTRGAAIYSNPDSGGRKVYFTIQNCIINNNTATNAGAVYSNFSPCGASSTLADIDFIECEIQHNYTADEPNILYSGNSQYSVYNRGEIVNCLITNNTSLSSAGAMYFVTSASGNSYGITVNVINTTIAKNTGASNKAIKLVRGSNTKFYNCIIYDNGSTQPLDITSGNPTIEYSLLQGAQVSGVGNQSFSIPLFIDAANGDFALNSGAVNVIDTGDNTKLPAGIMTDLLQNNRIYNTTVDMGCYEFGASPVLAVNQIENNIEYTVYPNPTNAIININLNEVLEKVEIFNMLGKKLIENKQTSINISNLPNGMYLIKITTENGINSTKRFIKQ